MKLTDWTEREPDVTLVVSKIRGQGMVVYLLKWLNWRESVLPGIRVQVVDVDFL